MSRVTFWSTSDPFVTVAEVVDRFHRDLGVRLRVRRWAEGGAGEEVDGLERVVGASLLLEPATGDDVLYADVGGEREGRGHLGAVVLGMRYVVEGDAEAYDRCALPGKPAFSDLRVVADVRPAEAGRDELVPGVVAVLAALYPGGVETSPEGRSASFGVEVADILGTVEPAARRSPPDRPRGLLGWFGRLFGG